MARFVPRSGFPFGVRSFEAAKGPAESATPETVVAAPAGDAQAEGGQQVVEVRPVQTAVAATAAGGVHVPGVAAFQPAGGAATASGGGNAVGVTVVAPAGEAVAHAPGAASPVWSDDFATPDAADYDHSSWVPGTFVGDGSGHLSADPSDYGQVDPVAAYPIGVSVDVTAGARAQFRFEAGDISFFDVLLGATDTEYSGTVFYAALTADATTGGISLTVDDNSGTGGAVSGSISGSSGWLVLKVDGTDLIGEVWDTDPALGGSPALTNTFAGADLASAGDRAGFDVPIGSTGAWIDDFQVYDQPEIVGDSATVLIEEVAPAIVVVAPSGSATATGGANAVIPFEAPTVIRGGGQPTHIVTLTAPAGEAVAEGGENRVTTREIDQPRVRVRRPRVRQRGPRTHPHPATTVRPPPALAYAHAGTNAARTTETVPLDVLYKQDEEFEELLVLGLV